MFFVNVTNNEVVKHTNNKYFKRRLKHMTPFIKSSIAAKTVCVRKLVDFIQKHFIVVLIKNKI